MPPSQQLAGFQEEIQFEVLHRLKQSPDPCQRILTKEVGISLGSINFCFQPMMEKGWIKIHNFSQSNHKLRYVHLLTPEGVLEKSKLTAESLRRKTAEYEALQTEINTLKSGMASPPSQE